MAIWCLTTSPDNIAKTAELGWKTGFGNEWVQILGVKMYADGWLGHQSIVPGASLLARVQPAERRIIVIASSTHHAGVLAARLFGDTVPALGMVSLPKRAPCDARFATRHSRYCGRYVRGRDALVIEHAGGPGADGGALMLIDGDTRAPLVPAERDILLAERAAPRLFVQPIQWDGERFRALWDGQHEPDDVLSWNLARDRAHEVSGSALALPPQGDCP